MKLTALVPTPGLFGQLKLSVISTWLYANAVLGWTQATYIDRVSSSIVDGFLFVAGGSEIVATALLGMVALAALGSRLKPVAEVVCGPEVKA